MDVLHGFEGLPLDAEASAVTIGFFDGVHRGHRTVIGRTVDVARRKALMSVAITFDRHPREVYAPGTEPKLLTTPERKANLIQELGVDTLVVLEFTEELARWPPEEFVNRVLDQGLHVAHAVVGSNFTFGHLAMGTLATLADLGAANGFDVEGVSLLRIDGQPVSSSSIRGALSKGDLVWPRHALGRRFTLDGTVQAGAGRGAGLGWPTANLAVPGRMLIPGEAVYAGVAHIADGSHPAAINVGTNPTFGDEPLHAEAHLLDFDGDLRGQAISLEFWERLREEVRFESAEDLARQIKEDVERTRAVIPG